MRSITFKIIAVGMSVLLTGCGDLGYDKEPIATANINNESEGDIQTAALPLGVCDAGEEFDMELYGECFLVEDPVITCQDNAWVTESLFDLSCLTNKSVPATETSCGDGLDNDGDGNTDCADLDCVTLSCDDSNACTQGEVCMANGSCEGGTDVDCDDDNVCTNDTCDMVDGCQYEDNTDSCEDGDACTEGDMCADGECTSGTDVDCDDGNVCTNDSCDLTEGCEYELLTGDTCDDDDACTEGDACFEGECSAKDVNCDDGDACTSDSCDSETGCTYTDVTCDDGNPCTTDTCDSETGCVYTEITCEDDGEYCTTEACNTENGECESTPWEDGMDCEDGWVCTVDSTCLDGVCQIGTADQTMCDDGDAENLDLCLFSFTSDTEVVSDEMWDSYLTVDAETGDDLTGCVSGTSSDGSLWDLWSLIQDTFYNDTSVTWYCWAPEEDNCPGGWEPPIWSVANGDTITYEESYPPNACGNTGDDVSTWMCCANGGGDWEADTGVCDPNYAVVTYSLLEE